MKSIKTTLAGIVGGTSIVIEALYDAYTSGAFDGKSRMGIIIGVVIIVLGTLSKDYNEKN